MKTTESNSESDRKLETYKKYMIASTVCLSIEALNVLLPLSKYGELLTIVHCSLAIYVLRFVKEMQTKQLKLQGVYTLPVHPTSECISAHVLELGPTVQTVWIQ